MNETNRKMREALKNIYKGNARLQEHGVKRRDCTTIWKKRTNIYADEPDQRVVNTGGERASLLEDENKIAMNCAKWLQTLWLHPLLN